MTPTMDSYPLTNMLVNGTQSPTTVMSVFRRIGAIHIRIARLYEYGVMTCYKLIKQAIWNLLTKQTIRILLEISAKCWGRFSRRVLTKVSTYIYLLQLMTATKCSYQIYSILDKRVYCEYILQQNLSRRVHYVPHRNMSCISK